MVQRLSQPRPPAVDENSMLPPAAGMVPTRADRSATGTPAPRARGDGPFAGPVPVRPFLCSPRPRGWSPAGSSLTSGSPTTAAPPSWTPTPSCPRNWPAGSSRRGGTRCSYTPRGTHSCTRASAAGSVHHFPRHHPTNYDPEILDRTRQAIADLGYAADAELWGPPSDGALPSVAARCQHAPDCRSSSSRSRSRLLGRRCPWRRNGLTRGYAELVAAWRPGKCRTRAPRRGPSGPGVREPC